MVATVAKSGPVLFVSHVAENRASALEVVEELERRGTRCWIAPRDVRAGMSFDDEIAGAIEASQALLLVFSDLCNDSEYIRREVTVAGESRKPVIVFRIEDVQPRKGLRVRLSDLHWIDGFIGRERALLEVIRAVSQSVPEASISAPRLPTKLGNLPTLTTRLLGRERELSDILAHLKSTRLVTLTGVGGIGKTRVAIQAASELSTTFPDGVWMVELAGVVDPGAVCHTVAGVLSIAQQPGQTIERSIIAGLAGRRLLLLLDNCEHLIASTATLASSILVDCPQVTVLATSREALMVDGEQVWPVPSLSVQHGGKSPAVELFVERARAVVPNFELGKHGHTVSEICRRLDGIPLAIELAAARVRAMSPEQIRDRLAERFQLLTGGTRRALERHQTLRHAMQWSYDLLSAREQMVLMRASVFAGGFSLDAAERVCGDAERVASTVLDLIDSLVRKSLVTVERTGNVVRYTMLETIRQFAEERLAEQRESEALRKRHAEFYADDSDRIFKIWRSPGESEAYRWLDQEINNLRVGFRWAVEQSYVDAAARIASNIGDMARFRLREDPAAWPQEIVEQARATRHPRLAVILTWCASNAWASSRFGEAKRFGEEAISLRDDPAFDSFIWAFADLAVVAMFEGDVDRAIHLLQVASEHPADQLDRLNRALLLYFLGTAGRREEGRKLAEDTVRAVDAAGVPFSIAFAYIGKGSAIEESDPVAGLSAYERAVAVARTAGNRMAESLAISRVAALHARSGAPLVALRGFSGMLNSYGDSTDLMFVLTWRANLVVLFAKLEHFEAAATLNGTLPASIDAKSVVAEYPDAVARVRLALGDAVFDELSQRGVAMALREGTTYAKDQVRRALKELSLPGSRPS
jgi:predicted ATPase